MVLRNVATNYTFEQQRQEINFLADDVNAIDGEITTLQSNVSSLQSLQGTETTDSPTFNNLTLTGYIAGPASMTIDPAAVGDNTGTLVIAGNLQVDGVTTTVNSETLTVSDKNITLASNATSNSTANGAGLTVAGANATLNYNGTTDEWEFNKNLRLSGNIFCTNVEPSNNIQLLDNKKLLVGTASDLQIYHDGDNSFIKDTGTGRLTIATSQLQLTNAADSEVMIRATQDSAVELYHNGTKRFETQSTGFKLTGRFYLNGSSGAIDYNNTAHTLEYIVNGSAHSELNGGAYVPAGNKNLGSNAARWQTLYLSNGIDFAGNSNAAGMSSEVLDDYEEGSFTPSILRQTSNPSVSYSYQNGKYTKVGNMVLVYFDLNITSISGGSGRYEIHGLPFSSSTDTASGGYGSPQFRNSTAFGSVTAQENPSSYHSGTTINLRYHSNASTESDISVTTGRITGWSMYFTNS